jgi:3'-phosphoadenosine 5'-phosphosulfate sulfotransferase (PAPS reductase)/FAD synthetase
MPNPTLQVATPDLRDYDAIVVNSSAGKDSQAMLDFMVELANAAGVRERLVVVHACLGAEEWPDTKELAAEHAAHYGLRFEVVKAPGLGLLGRVRKRRKWPDPARRWCTSDLKRTPVQKLITQLHREYGSKFYFKVLNCMGMRAQESTGRAKLLPFQTTTKKGKPIRGSTQKRTIHIWLPIHAWLVDQVWARIKAAGTRHHYAYDLGMSRLSCRLCIFAPRAQLLRSGLLNPELLAEYVEVEKEIGHKFRLELPLADVQRAIENGEKPPDHDGDEGCWNM